MKSENIAISLDLINRHYQEPNRNRYESRYFWEELYSLVAASGFSSVEMPYEPVWQFGGRSGVPFNRYCINTKYGDVDAYRTLLKERGIYRVSGITFDSNLFMRNASLDFYFGATGHFAREALGYAAEIGASYFAISPSPFYGRIAQYHPDLQNVMQDFTARTVKLLSELAEIAAGSGVELVLRNEYWSLFGPQKIFSLLEALDGKAKMDVDSANLFIAGVSAEGFIKNNIRQIGCVHLTDTNFTDENNIWKTANPEFPEDRATQVFRDPGTGSVNLESITTLLLDELDYRGPITCSARQTRDPFRALTRTRALLNQLEK